VPLDGLVLQIKMLGTLPPTPRVTTKREKGGGGEREREREGEKEKERAGERGGGRLTKKELPSTYPDPQPPYQPWFGGWG